MERQYVIAEAGGSTGDVAADTCNTLPCLVFSNSVVFCKQSGLCSQTCGAQSARQRVGTIIDLCVVHEAKGGHRCPSGIQAKLKASMM